MLKQEAAGAGGCALAGAEGKGGQCVGWGLGGKGPLIKTQTIVSPEALPGVKQGFGSWLP